MFKQVDGADWSRHRRSTAVAFSETVHEAVWITSCAEASDMLKHFMSQEYVSSTHPNMIRLSFTVLLKACLGLDDNSGADAASPINNAAKTHLEAFFNMISRNPDIRRGGRKSLVSFHASHQGIQSVMESLVKYRRDHPSSKKDLLSSMLSSQDAHMLSNEEIESNLFLFMFAGHETTANTLVYMIYLLAVFPEWQTWVVQEIDQIFSDVPLDNKMPYKDIFNRLTRLKAVMVSHFYSESMLENYLTRYLA
jgi:cytochrome P450